MEISLVRLSINLLGHVSENVVAEGHFYTLGLVRYLFRIGIVLFSFHCVHLVPSR
jgi:hypothetical protein